MQMIEELKTPKNYTILQESLKKAIKEDLNKQIRESRLEKEAIKKIYIYASSNDKTGAEECFKKKFQHNTSNPTYIVGEVYLYMIYNEMLLVKRMYGILYYNSNKELKFEHSKIELIQMCNAPEELD